MGWSELIDWVFDSDDSYYEHLKKDYGEDAPVVHAIFDTALDTISVTTGSGLISSIVGSKAPTSKEARDAIWEDRHEILAVGGAAPVIGTAISAIDSCLHAVEGFENNVEFFVEGATGEDEAIYDENGNVIGWKDKWMTEEMQRKAYYAESHGVNATVGAVLTMTGANYFKGGKAAVQTARKSGNFIEKLFLKNIDDAGEAVVSNASKREAAEAAYKESVNTMKAANTEAKQAAVNEAKENVLAFEARQQVKAATTKTAKDQAKQQVEDHALYAGVERSKKEVAEQTAQAAKQQAFKAATEKEMARRAQEAALKKYGRGVRAIDALSASNNIRSFLTTSVSVGLAEVSIYNKNIDRQGVSDKYKAPTIPYVNE